MCTEGKQAKNPGIPAAKIIFTSSHVAPRNPPDTQNPTICDWFDKSPATEVSAVKKVLIAVPAKSNFVMKNIDKKFSNRLINAKNHQ